MRSIGKRKTVEESGGMRSKGKWRSVEESYLSLADHLFLGKAAEQFTTLANDGGGDWN